MMDASQTNDYFLMCKDCYHPVKVDRNSKARIKCDRCGCTNRDSHQKSVHMTLAFSLTALILYFPANIFPFMTLELYGRRNSSTIWEGIVSLANDGSLFVAIVVFLASILIPLIKLLILFYLSFAARNAHHPRFKTRLYHFVEAIGRWSMLDIFLLAILVALVKLGNWTHVEPGMGALFFLFVVIFTMMASASFDPQILWEKENENSN